MRESLTDLILHTSSTLSYISLLQPLILLGFADRTKIAGKQVGPPEAEKSNPLADSTQPTNKLVAEVSFSIKLAAHQAKAGFEAVNAYSFRHSY